MTNENNPRANHGQLAPGLETTANRYSANYYERAFAQPRHMADRTRRSHEELRAEEGLWRQAAAPFFEQVDSADRTVANEFQYVQAGQANGRVEPGRSNPPAPWQHVPAEVRASFAGAANGDQETIGVASPAVTQRRGTLAPTWGTGVERPGNIVVAVQPDESAPWRQRRNQSEVEGRP
jgi:hypothetical protein